VTKYVDLPPNTIKEHKIKLILEIKLVRLKQKRMAPEKMVVLRVELDRLLEGRFITKVRNTEWVLSMVIVPKKGGKWRVCVNNKALN